MRACPAAAPSVSKPEGTVVQSMNSSLLATRVPVACDQYIDKSVTWWRLGPSVCPRLSGHPESCCRRGGTRCCSADLPLSYRQLVRLMVGALEWKEMTEELLSEESGPNTCGSEGTTAFLHRAPQSHRADPAWGKVSREGTRRGRSWAPAASRVGLLGQLRGKCVYFLTWRVPRMPPRGCGRAARLSTARLDPRSRSRG